MRLIITRHGETIENKQGIMQGHLQGNLSENGRKQAKKLSERLKNEKIDFIYSSDLARAADTANEIAKYHKDIPVHFVEELREKNLGEYTGKSWLEVSNFDELINSDDGRGGIESRKHAKERILGLLSLVTKKYPGKTVLFVGHNGINKILIRAILEESNFPCEDLVDQHNTAVNVFEIRKEKDHKIKVLNCVKHLNCKNYE